jgi:cytochrome c oxidase subunit 1
MLFAVGLVSQFTIGGLSGVMHASPPVDGHHNDTYFVVAHFHYVLFGGSIFGLLAGAYYWFPKMTGKMMDDRLGKLNFWTTFIGFNATFFPMHFLGLDGMPRRYYTYGEGSGWSFWNALVTAGAFFLGASMLLFVYNLARSIKHGEPSGPNPWDAATLEWAIPSPPPSYNFANLPLVGHRDPVWWDKYGSDTHGGHPGHVEGERQDLSQINEETGHIHMPNPSYYPILVALGLFVVALGLLFQDPAIAIGLLHLPLLCALGAILLVASIYGWAFEPASDPEPTHVEHHSTAGH